MPLYNCLDLPLQPSCCYQSIHDYSSAVMCIHMYYTLFSIKGIKANNARIRVNTGDAVNTPSNQGQRGMISNPIYDGPLYETIGESKPCFDSLPKLTRAVESCYVDTVGAQLLAPSPDMEALLSGGSEESAGRRLSNGAAANSNGDGDYAVMKPA